MLGSRILPIFSRVAKFGAQNGKKQFSTSTVMKGGAPYNYRQYGEPPKFNVRYAEVMGAIMWWWIFWHVFTDYEHIIGHHEFVSASTWTDEELGIPPDDAEDPE